MNILEKCRKSGDLLEAEYLILVHAEVLGNPCVCATKFMQFADNIAHQIHVMGTACPVMPDRACHAVVHRFVDDAHGQQSVLAGISIRMLQHDTVPVKSIHDDVEILFPVMITDNGHGVAVFFDTVIEEFHFRRCYCVGIVCIWHDFFNRDSDYIIYGTSERHFLHPPFCTFLSEYLYFSAVPG